MMRWATVVSVEDPLGLRRVRVRIETVHGSGFPEALLPWAETGEQGGSPDAGAYPVFVKGQSVLVSCENGDITRPAVMRGITKPWGASQKYGESGWVPVEGENDVPSEAADPTVHMVFKTPNGAALFVKEKPGEEKMFVVDRAGQYIELSSPSSGTEVGGDKRGVDTAPSSEAETKLTGDAAVRAVDVSGNMVWLHTGTDGFSRVKVDNPRNGNFLRFDENGLVVEVLGGQAEGGLTLVMDSAGLRLNGVELATRKLVDLIDAYSATMTLSTKPGTPAPMFPAQKAVFDVRKLADINSDGLLTQL